MLLKNLSRIAYPTVPPTQEPSGEGLSYQGDSECFPGVHTILCFATVVLSGWREADRAGGGAHLPKAFPMAEGRAS